MSGFISDRSTFSQINFILKISLLTWFYKMWWRGHWDVASCRSGPTSTATRRRRRPSSERLTARPISFPWPRTSFDGNRGFGGRSGRSRLRGPVPCRKRIPPTKVEKAEIETKMFASTSSWCPELIYVNFFKKTFFLFIHSSHFFCVIF